MPSTINVLMTGAGAPGAAGIIKCLLQDPRIKLSVADCDPEAIGRHLHARYFQLPAAGDERFVNELLALCRRERIEVILPLVTRELLPLANVKAGFEKEGIRVLVSSPNAIATANDKGACYAFLSANGLRVPRFCPATTPAEFVAAAADLNYPDVSFCFKPCVSNGSRGFRIVVPNLDESEQLFRQKPYNQFISYDHAIAILSARPFPPLVVSEFLPGEEYSVDCLANHGEAVLIVPRLRQKTVNGISIAGRFVKDAPIEDYCQRIIKTIGLHGNIGIQLRRSAVGEALLLEINPRVQGTIVAGLGAGVNLPLLAVQQEMFGSIDPSQVDVKWGTSFARHWTEVFY